MNSNYTQITAQEQKYNNAKQKYRREVKQEGQEKTFRILHKDETAYGRSSVWKDD